jgi:hypothetical protein
LVNADLKANGERKEGILGMGMISATAIHFIRQDDCSLYVIFVFALVVEC